MIRTVIGICVGYMGYHCAHTPQGRELAKTAFKSALQHSGVAEEAITKALVKALEAKPEVSEECPDEMQEELIETETMEQHEMQEKSA